LGALAMNHFLVFTAAIRNLRWEVCTFSSWVCLH
jgi:hypothetical protein